MKTTIKTLGFIGLTILLIFVLTKNKEIRQYKINEQEQLEVLDTLQLELDSLKIQLKNILHLLLMTYLTNYFFFYSLLII